ncbi:MAG: NAD(P)H-dependent glycerol-3-phosphate dehydrogenase [Caldimonas sp.]
MNVTVLGAGAWGTAIAVHAVSTNTVRLWARDARQAAALRSLRRNARYLPEVALPPSLQVSADFDASVRHAQGGLLVVATPLAGLGGVLRRLPERMDTSLLWLCKGFEQGTGWLGHEIARDAVPQARVGVLSGPSFAIEVARGQPTALVAASVSARVCDDAVAALHTGALRIYTSADPVGVEVGGAVKNVLAIATGIADGMALGLNARAALVTRGLAEMTRLGIALGAAPETFMGLSGLGDLVLTTTGELSRNRRVGLRLAAGQALGQILAELGHVAEGVASAPMVLQRAHARGVEMPIVEAVVQVLDGRLSPDQALGLLMRRDARPESLGG